MKNALVDFRWVVQSGALATGLFGALGCISIARADDVIPKAFPADRYAKMAAHSPFTPPTPQAAPANTPPPAPVPGFADKLTATMISEDSGVYIITVADPDSSQHFLVYSDREDETTHLQIASVKWPRSNDDQPGTRPAPEITLRKGTLFSSVRYEPGGGGSGPIGGAPGGGMPGGINRSFIPGNAGVRPPGMPAIPGNATGGVAMAPPPVPAPAAQVGPGGLRRAPIRSFPQQVTAPAPGVARPVVPANTGVRPGATKVDDDDDDDD